MTTSRPARFTTRHHRLLAAALHEAMVKAGPSKDYECGLVGAGVDYAVETIGKVLKEDNPRFDFLRFCAMVETGKDPAASSSPGVAAAS